MMDYDDQKSVENYDDAVRDTIEQGSLSSYSKNYVKNKKKAKQ